MWQDYVMMASNFVFALALIPTIRGSSKPPLSTSLLTGSILLVLCITVATLSLWLASATDLLASTMWFILVYQKWKQNGH